MPLSKSSPLYLHILQNTALLCISFIFTPVCILTTSLFFLISPLTKTHQQAIQAQNQKQAPTCSQRRILVTGVGMSKGLFLARCFYLAGHSVIGADFEPDGVYVPGRFSRALQSYYRLVQPPSPSSAAQETSNGFAKAYANQILELVRREKIELWVSCSGVATAVEDGETAEVVSRETGCKVVQFGAGWTGVLHDKYSFIEHTARVGLTVPDTRLVTSIADAVEYLHPARRKYEEEHKKDQEREWGGKRYILKPAGMEDSSRADMTLLPLPTSTQTTHHLKAINPSPSRPFVLQQFLTGQEFCTHALILKGEVRAFVACPSADILMHYQALPARCRLSRALELYTTRYVTSMGDRMSGHFSLDFMVDERAFGGFTDMDVNEYEIERGLRSLFPIECNPRAHTAVLLFADQMPELAEIYLSLLDPEIPQPSHTAKYPPSKVLHASPRSPKIYWLAHDVVTNVFLPLLLCILRRQSAREAMTHLRDFGAHLLLWKDGTLEIWDAGPWCWLCVGYWPAKFGLVLQAGVGSWWMSPWKEGGRWWSRCNVSTNKIFRC
ncbi:hypothetical protein BP5796_03951 [Coleophoma crateriformis]|uniref:ATP-grasp domain-containing protein n=1 Tax=Coleophoma crateriformis TaxID=565419 RepID=A0A3D8SH42_9HELO|nr:hypothetical protein BP5796_03951 [Coleophoma crateriformis]